MLNSPIEEIKNRLDIVDVVGSYIKLQKVGQNYRALCPFHSEKKPSFFVSPGRQTWHCFGSCSEGGDIFKFVMKIEGVEFGDSLRILAQKAGIELKKQDPKLRTERQRLYEICEIAAQFFEKQLENSKTGKKAEEYLLKRGLTRDSIKKWRLGYSPDVWNSLSDFLVGQGYKREEVVSAGLAIKKEENSAAFGPAAGDSRGFYDRFRGRIIFPIFDLNSQVVGFTARVFAKSQEVAKYINTPNTLLYDKSRILYGLDKAKLAIRNKDECVLVEGQTDVIMSHQVGLENVAATSGTALTPDQLALLKRYTENLITGFDMDIAGDSATKKGIELAQSLGFNIKVVLMPKDLDPADVIFKNPEDWSEMVKNSKSILEFYFESAFSHFAPKTPEGKKEISKILLPAIKRIPNRIEQSYWVGQLAKKLEVKEEDIEVEMKKIIIDPNQGLRRKAALSLGTETEDYKDRGPKNNRPRTQILEERILSLVLRTPQNLSFIPADSFAIFSSQIQEVFNNLKDDFDFFKKERSQEIKGFLDRLYFEGELEEEIEPEKEIQTCILQMRLIETKKKLDEISQQIKKAEEGKNDPEVDSLTQEFNRICSSLNEIWRNSAIP